MYTLTNTMLYVNLIDISQHIELSQQYWEKKLIKLVSEKPTTKSVSVKLLHNQQNDGHWFSAIWIPGLGRSPGEGKGPSPPVFWPGESQGWYSPWGPKELDTTE